MDFDGTISTEVALIHDKDQYDDIVTLGLANDNDGKPMPAQLGVGGGVHPEGREECRGRQGFHEIRDPAAGRRTTT